MERFSDDVQLIQKKKDLVKCKFSSMLCWKLDTLKWTSKKQID